MTALVAPMEVGATGGWRRHGRALAAVAAVLLLLFAHDVGGLVSTWWTSTTFGHCFFIAPIVGWLVWQRRTELSVLRPVAWWPGLVLVVAGGAGWLVGDAASVTFARQLGLVLMLQGAVVTVLGPVIARGLAFPLFYAFFLVPFGEWLEAPLQAVTVRLVMPLLALVGVPATSDGVMIHAGRYYFEVAEACSGAKFVIAMAAFGVLVANVCFTSWRRRVWFMAASVVVPILANGVRAFATIWVADLTSVETAAGFDHIVYGWVWFGVVMAATLAIGWRWFDRAPDAPAFDPAAIDHRVVRAMPLMPAALLVLAAAVLAPAWSAATAHAAAPLPERLHLPEVPGWTRVPLSTDAAWQPFYPGADHHLIGRYADQAGHRVDLGIAVFARQREGSELIAYGTGAEGPDPWLRVADLPPIAGGSAMRIRAPGPHDRVVATWYRLGGTVTASPAEVKLRTLATRLTGGDQHAVAIHLSVETGSGPIAADAIEAFLRAQPIDRLVERMLSGAPAAAQSPARS
jgi:exosortase A